MKLLYIALGGAFGTLARYLISSLVSKWAGGSFSLATLIINVIGSFLISFIMQPALTSSGLTPDQKTILAVGILGGFTTYSGFNHETLGYFQQGEVLTAFGYTLLMVTCCLASGFLGIWLSR